MKKSASGFTIVELLIVVVIIAILAAIVVVAYNGITTRAKNTSRANEVKAWARLFEAYKAANGQLPTLATNIHYCLGTGFPVGPNSGGVPRCRDYNGTGANSYPESTGTALAAELATVGRIPGAEKVAVGGTVGPYLQHTSGGNGYIIGWFDGSASSDCPDGLNYIWTDGTARVACATILRP